MARSVLSNWVLFGFNAVVGFLLSPFVVHHLGNTQYGLWTLLGSIVGYLGLLDFGVRGAVTWHVARFVGAGDYRAVERHVAVAMRLYFIIGGAVLLGSILLAASVHRLTSIPPELLGPARAALVLTGAALAVSLIAGVFGGLVIGFERFDLANGADLAIGLLRVAGVVATLSAGYGIVALALVQLGVAILRGGVQFALARFVAREVSIGLGYWNATAASGFLKFGVISTALQVGTLLAFYTDSIVISAFLPVALVAYFAIGSSLTQYMREIVSGLSFVMTPRVSALAGGGATGEVGELFLVVGRLAVLVVLPMAITLFVRGGTFIGLWMGTSYIALSGQVLRILVLAVPFSAARQVATATVMGLARHQGLVPAVVAEGLANVAISVALVGPWALAGVAWGTTIPNLAVSALFLPWYLKRHLGVPPSRMATELLVRPFVAMLPFALATVYVEHAWRPQSLAVFFLQVGLTLAAALGGVVAVGLTPLERRRLSAFLSNRLGLRANPHG
ncbi:MAG TPA: polysaccharide biosynthesis C-terminal domain-containing protein [Gemmatimonadales bacterium]|jgi:O-antigen/teichoic acid export membrane protein|nr:polysaccharide biosynthesis C-terminal domain-containing protein [Gemmatimonadales bacterium]